MQNKPFLFLTSSEFGKIENLYFLKDLGKVLNLAEEKKDENEYNNYAQYQFIICNMKNDKEISKLRYINIDNVYKVAVLRGYESSNDAWIQKLKPDFTIKSFDFIRQCQNIYELYNYIKSLSSFKKPDNDALFYVKKGWSFLSCICGSSK
jgi:hypothetical protein